jgi:hypothetical protein
LIAAAEKAREETATRLGESLLDAHFSQATGLADVLIDLGHN